MAHKRGRESRADRLGEALRANLRRRKLAPAGSAAGDGGQIGGNRLCLRLTPGSQASHEEAGFRRDECAQQEPTQA